MNSPNQLSFLPDDYLERKARRRTNAICAVLFLLVAGGIGGAFAYTDAQLREARRLNAKVARDYADAARPIQQFQQLQEKQRTMAHQAELTASLLEKVPRSFLLAELTNSMPGGVALLDLSLDSRPRPVAPPAGTALTNFDKKRAELDAKKAAPEGPQPKVYDVTIKITGIASTDAQVAQYIAKLNASKLLRDVNLNVSEEFVQGTEKLRKFQVDMTLNPSAEITPASHPEPVKTVSVELSNQ